MCLLPLFSTQKRLQDQHLSSVPAGRGDLRQGWNIGMFEDNRDKRKTTSLKIRTKEDGLKEGFDKCLRHFIN